MEENRTMVKYGRYDRQGILHSVVFLDTFESDQERDRFLVFMLGSEDYFFIDIVAV